MPKKETQEVLWATQYSQLTIAKMQDSGTREFQASTYWELELESIARDKESAEN